MSNLMELFIRDSRNYINQLVDSLIKFKKDSNDKLEIESAFRAAHSIKSEASYLQLDNITNLAHEIEDELETFLTGEIDFSKEKYDSIIEKTEKLQEMIEMAGEEALGISDMDPEYEVSVITDEDIDNSDKQLSNISNTNKTEISENLKYNDDIKEDKDLSDFENIKSKEESNFEESDNAVSENDFSNSEEIADIELGSVDIVADQYDAADINEKTVSQNSDILNNEISDSQYRDNNKSFDEFQIQILSESMKRGEKLYLVTCDILPESVMKYARLYLIVNNLELHTNLIKTIPYIDAGAALFSDSVSDAEKEENTRIKCYITTKKSYDQIYEIVNVDEIKNIQIVNLPYELYINSLHSKYSENITPGSKTVSVKIERLDSLFVSTHKMRMELNTKNDYSKKNSVSVLDQNLGDMENLINNLRMATLSDEFSSMPSLINKIAFSRGKEAGIIFNDNNIEIDRALFEYIYDPIIHIFKNAIDHGIETVEERNAKGKNPKGRIECKTYLENGSLIIRITDDGKGVDFAKIAEKSGYSVTELKEQPDKLFSVISSPGFTTKENADEHSGRGFGMNLVEEKLSQIRGASLEIDSKEGEGTVISIKLSDNYIGRNVLYIVSNGEITAIPSEIIENKIDSLKYISKTDSNQIIYKDIPVYTKDGILFSDSIDEFKKLKGIIIKKNNEKALILAEKILFEESIPADRFYLMQTSIPYLFMMKIAELDNEYYYLDSSIIDYSRSNV